MGLYDCSPHRGSLYSDVQYSYIKVAHYLFLFIIGRVSVVFRRVLAVVGIIVVLGRIVLVEGLIFWYSCCFGSYY